MALLVVLACGGCGKLLRRGRSMARDRDGVALVVLAREKEWAEITHHDEAPKGKDWLCPACKATKMEEFLNHKRPKGRKE